MSREGCLAQMNCIALFVGCVFILVALLPGRMVRGRSNVPHESPKLTRIVLVVLAIAVILAWWSYSQR